MRRPNEIDGKYLDIMTGTEGGHEIKKLPNVEGEYDREESPRRVWDNYSPPNFGYKEIADAEKATGKKQTWDLNSEQFAVDQAVQYEKISAPSHNGGAKWIYSDTTSGGRVTVETTRASGAVDGVRLPKEAYYATQVIFSDTPAIHIIGHWTYPAKTVKPIYVMANCDEVELYINHKFAGDGTRSNHFLFTWPDVKFSPGTIEAIGYTGGKVVCTTQLHTAGAPAKIRLTPITGPDGLRATGSDVALLDAEVVDDHGERCPTFQGRIDFSTSGPCLWRGGYNSGKEHSTNNTYLDLECGINRVAVRSTLQPGTIHIEATIEGLPSASIDIPSTAIPIHNGMTAALPVLITPNTDSLSK
jgi:beta-galactosidase